MSEKNTNNKDMEMSSQIKVTSKNIKILMKQQGINQDQLADQTGFAASAVSNYVNGKIFPKIAFLWSLHQLFNISIDDFITKELAPFDLNNATEASILERKEREAYEKYCGSYYVYYFDTSNYKGRDFNTPEDSILYGIVRIYKDAASGEKFGYSCLAILGFKKPDMVKTLMEELSRFDDTDISSMYDFINNNPNYSEKTYYGDCELTADSVFLTLSHKQKDRALIILHRVPSNAANYSGGIGTINSVSRGRETMPVVQFMGLSDTFLNVSLEEIHHNLLPSFPNFKAREEAEELISTFKKFYGPDAEGSDILTDFEKEVTITANIDRVLKKIITRNMLRYGKISMRDDDEWYHFIKHSKENKEDIDE